MQHIYWIKILWYNDYSERTVEDNAIITASNYQEVIEIVEHDYPDNVESVSIELLSDTNGLIFIDAKDSNYIKEMIKNANEY